MCFIKYHQSINGSFIERLSSVISLQSLLKLVRHMLVLASTYKYKINARLSEYLTIFKNNFYSNHPPKKYIICTFFCILQKYLTFFYVTNVPSQDVVYYWSVSPWLSAADSIVYSGLSRGSSTVLCSTLQAQAHSQGFKFYLKRGFIKKKYFSLSVPSCFNPINVSLKKTTQVLLVLSPFVSPRPPPFQCNGRDKK